MKTYTYQTDAVSGTVLARTGPNALRRVCRDENVNARTRADGGWAWVEDAETHQRWYVDPLTTEARSRDDRPKRQRHTRRRQGAGCTCRPDEQYAACPCGGTGRVLVDTPEGPRLQSCPPSMGGLVLPMYGPDPETARRLLREYTGDWAADPEVVALAAM